MSAVPKLVNATPVLSLDSIVNSSKIGSWYDPIRTEALEKYTTIPFPSDSDEAWRYTSPRKFDWSTLSSPTTSTFTLSAIKNNSLPEGITLRQNSELNDADRKLISNLILDTDTKGYKRSSDALGQLQTALLGGVAVITVSKGVKISDPLNITLKQDSDSGFAASLVVIVAEESSDVTLVENLKDKFSGLLMPRVEVILRKNSYVNYISIQNLPIETSLLSYQRIIAERDTRGEFINIELGAKVARVDLDCKLVEQGSSINLFSLGLSDKKRHLDFHPNQEHLAPHCHSDLYVKNVLKDQSRSVYYGYIKVAEGSQKTDAYQTNRNLLLSDSARADSIPNLEIKANDVKCSHGSSIGQVSKDELFYLCTRGLTPEQAEKLLVEGFLTDLISRIKSEYVRDMVTDLVLNRFNN